MKTTILLVTVAVAIIGTSLTYAYIRDQKTIKFMNECREKGFRPLNIGGEIVCMDPSSVRILYPQGYKNVTQ